MHNNLHTEQQQDGSEQLAGRLVAAAAARIAVSQQNQRGLKLRMDKDVIYLQEPIIHYPGELMWDGPLVSFQKNA